MADLVNQMLQKFAELAQEEKNISAESENAFKEYNDYCASSDSDLSEKIQHYRKKIAKVEELMDYAREHAQPDDLEEAQMPFETSEGALESIRQTIKLDSHNDPNAESLFTKASGMKLFYESELERTKKLIEGSKVQAKRQYDSDIAAIEKRKIQHEADEKAYIQSDDFKQYLKLLSFDKSAFNSQGTVNLLDKSSISLGQRRVKLLVPMEVEQELSALSKGEYNSAARTIGAPFGVSTEKGSVLMLDFDERNKAYLLGGVERLLLNFIKYFGQELTDVVFCDAESFSPDVLGVLAALARGTNPFITVPKSADEAQSKLAELAAKIEQEPVSDGISRIIVLHGFPEKYGEDIAESVLKISETAENGGVLLVLTHDNSQPQTEIEAKIRGNAVSIRSRNGAFWVESTRESLFWYSAPSEIPDEILRIYVEQRRQQAARTAHEEAQPVQPAEPVHEEVKPAPEQEAAQNEPQPVHEEAPESVPENGGEKQPEAAPEAPFGADENVPPHIFLNLPRPKEETEISFEEVAEVTEKIELEPEQSAVEQPEPVRDEMPIDEPQNDAPAREEIAAEKAEIASEPAEKPANSPAKGNRTLDEIVVGKDMDGNAVCADICGNIAYVCGKNGADRAAVVENIINQITAKKHPDEAEIWAFDQKSELLKSVNTASPYVKFAVSDAAPHVAADIVERLEDELNARSTLFAERGYESFLDVPADEYLPRIIAFIGDFREFLKALDNAPKMFGRCSRDKLAKIFAGCGKYGINLVLIGETFSENGEKPDVFKNTAVHCAIVTTGAEKFAETMIEGVKLYENQIESLKKVPAGCAFVSVPEKDGELYLARIVPVDNTNKCDYTAVCEYSESYGEYVDKHAFAADRNAKSQFADGEKSREELLQNRADGEIMLFLGEPCRLAENLPVVIHDDFGENILAVAPALQKKYAANAVAAAILSLKEQNVAVEVLAARSNPVYRELSDNGMLDGIDVFEGEKGEKRISELSKEIAENGAAKRFVIVLGGDVLLAALSADDLSGDLKRLLAKGSRAGVHVMFVCGNANGFSNGFVSLFRHKAVFPCEIHDAEKLLRFTDCVLPEGAFRLSDDYDEFTVITYENCKNTVLS